MFTVTWSSPAKARLAELWMAAAARQAVADAANHIDALLRRNPLAVGESRERENRILFESPLGILYHVSEEDRLVEVWAVWSTAS